MPNNFYACRSNGNQYTNASLNVKMITDLRVNLFLKECWKNLQVKGIFKSSTLETCVKGIGSEQYPRPYSIRIFYLFIGNQAISCPFNSTCDLLKKSSSIYICTRLENPPLAMQPSVGQGSQNRN